MAEGWGGGALLLFEEEKGVADRMKSSGGVGILVHGRSAESAMFLDDEGHFLAPLNELRTCRFPFRCLCPKHQPFGRNWIDGPQRDRTASANQNLHVGLHSYFIIPLATAARAG